MVIHLGVPLICLRQPVRLFNAQVLAEAFRILGCVRPLKRHECALCWQGRRSLEAHIVRHDLRARPAERNIEEDVRRSGL